MNFQKGAEHSCPGPARQMMPATCFSLRKLQEQQQKNGLASSTGGEHMYLSRKQLGSQRCSLCPRNPNSRNITKEFPTTGKQAQDLAYVVYSTKNDKQSNCPPTVDIKKWVAIHERTLLTHFNSDQEAISCGARFQQAQGQSSATHKL